MFYILLLTVNGCHHSSFMLTRTKSVNQSTQRKQLARVPLLTNSFRETDSEEQRTSGKERKKVANFCCECFNFNSMFQLIWSKTVSVLTVLYSDVGFQFLHHRIMILWKKNHKIMILWKKIIKSWFYENSNFQIIIKSWFYDKRSFYGFMTTS